jgi:hypothetical protein
MQNTRSTDKSSSPQEFGGRKTTWQEMGLSEDWWAVWIGSTILVAALAAVWLSRPSDLAERILNAEPGERIELTSPGKTWFANPGSWESDPRESLMRGDDPSTQGDESRNVLPGSSAHFWSA